MLRFSHISFLLLAALLLDACQPVQPQPPVLLATPAQQVAAVAAATSMPSPAAVAKTAAPRPTRPARVKLTAERKTFTSQALAGNLLGDPVERGFYVVLPSDYATSNKRYPVVYDLHGYGGNEYSEPMGIQQAQESALRYGRVKEMILVFPDAGNKLGGSMYLSSPTIGDYETYLTNELVDYIDANYRTLPRRESRGITGCSMGADGAIHLAMKYPDVYGVAVPYSATYVWTKDPWLAIGAIGYKRDPATIDDFRDLPTETQAEIAVAAAVAPNPDKPPFYLDMPYVVENGKTALAPGFIEKVAAASPVQDARNYAAQPARLRGILLYHGLYDDLAPVEGAREFDALLTELGIEHQYLEVEGTHCGMDFEPVLKFMSDHLEFEEAGQ